MISLFSFLMKPLSGRGIGAPFLLPIPAVKITTPISFAFFAALTGSIPEFFSPSVRIIITFEVSDSLSKALIPFSTAL